MAGKSTPALIAQELVQLRTMLEQIEKRESASKQAFNVLYDELEQYKKDFIFQLEKSLLIDLLLFYDSLVWFQSSISDKDIDANQNLTYLIDEYLEILQRRDVYPFQATPKFDPKIHRIIQNNDVNDPSLDQVIHRVLKRGFYRGEQILRVEEVIVNRFIGVDETNDTSCTEDPVIEQPEAIPESDTADET